MKAKAKTQANKTMKTKISHEGPKGQEGTRATLRPGGHVDLRPREKMPEVMIHVWANHKSSNINVRHTIYDKRTSQT